jgi:ethanolamine ammonia-lyase large subunit
MFPWKDWWGRDFLLQRRRFLAGAAGGVASYGLGRGGPLSTAQGPASTGADVTAVSAAVPREDLFSYIHAVRGGYSRTLYKQLLGQANEFKEGDASLGVAATDAASRQRAQALLTQTLLGDLRSHRIHDDALWRYIEGFVDASLAEEMAAWSVGELRRFLLESEEASIRRLMPGLASDVIACVVKCMTNDELIAVGSKVFNPLPGSQIGARGYLGARIQPNSPTDHVDDIQWQVFNGFAFAVGDVLLGTNPVSSDVDSVWSVEQALAEILRTFALEDVMPHCVLAHIDVQARVEQAHPGSTALWFQSLAGVEDANATFDISVAKMVRHAASRTGKYGLYFETGQGADATNGHGKGFDMVLHEARKYGFARALAQETAAAQARAGRDPAPWVHVNDVAGFIGPEIFRSREQLVRCCLEDIVMGKLHGLTIGLDICSTLHMEVDLDDLDWCIEQVMPACPAYLMALPTKTDPMLGYLTTAFQDHVRIREKFGFRVSDPMWQFFQSLGVIDASGRPTAHFGQPNWVYLQFCRRKRDPRSDEEILQEGGRKMREVRERGVFLAEGYGERPWEPAPELDGRIRHLYADSKKCVWSELAVDFADRLPNSVPVKSRSRDRREYILHPPTGEVLDEKSTQTLRRLRDSQAGVPDVQLVVSDGLNPFAITDPNHLMPFVKGVREALQAAGYLPAEEHLVVRGGRVRIGYRMGEILFGHLPPEGPHRAILHIIGERPGSGHHAFSVYITAPKPGTWSQAGAVDHNLTKVVSGIADTALPPIVAAVETVKILQEIAPIAAG